MRFLSWSDILAEGEIRKRAKLLWERLGASMYQPPEIFSKEAENGGWPGDWEGRTLLALVLLSETTGESSERLHAILDELPQHYNDRGYLGAILPEGTFDEQQLSGHSWLLRALCAYAEKTGDPVVTEEIVTIVRNLYLPARAAFDEYPDRSATEGAEGAYAGAIMGKTGTWRLSSDVGCAFISLDGLSCAYVCLMAHGADAELLEELRALLSVMVKRFAALQPEVAGMQTHATLTATRGLIRLYEALGDEVLIHTARRIFALYTDKAMTATFSNYNWFSRPAWTEPCGVIDSFIIACRLYGHTGDSQYAEYANLILYNGIYASQRANGGFGLDNCVGAAAYMQFLLPQAYEAYWCCTMRGGEGLSEALRYSIVKDGDDRLVMLYPMDGIFRCGDLTLKVETDYPMGWETTITVLENRAAGPVRLSLFLPDGVMPMQADADYGEFEITKDTAEIYFRLRGKLYQTEVPNGGSGALFRYGTLILGAEIDDGGKAVTPDRMRALPFPSPHRRVVTLEDGSAVYPICERLYHETDGECAVLQVLF